MGELGPRLAHEFFSDGLMGLHCTLSNLWAPNLKSDFRCHTSWKSKHGAPILLFISCFKDCVMIINVWFWYFLSSTLTHGDTSGRVSVQVFEKFHSLFSFLFFFFLFFFFSFLFFFSSLSGAPLAPGPLDIVHPCHPVATPLIEYPTPAFCPASYAQHLM